jgi:nicotinamide-nucleotide amidase
MLTVAVLCTGSELTRGELVNTNATWLAEALTALGFEVAAIDTVADDRARIRDALERLGREHTAVVCTGGLGPTTDDLTTECVAELLGVPLVRDTDSLEAIRARMHRFGRTMAASNAKQADFPEGATILPNARGTAPGFSVRIGQALAFFLPGVPSEMKAMFSECVAPVLEAIDRPRQFQVRLGTYGMAESEVNDRLAGIEAEHDVVIGYRASIPTIEVKVLARADTTEVARVRAEAGAAEVRKRLGDLVFSQGVQSYPAALLALLEARGKTLAIAESCTGGLVAALLTDVAGSSKSLVGGAVTYSNALKQALLGVPESLLVTHGAVSREVAEAMAEGARTRLGADIGLALTGIAGPGGGTTEKPVGLVHWAVATAEGITAREQVFPGDRQQVRHRAAYAGLALVRRGLI